MWHKPAQFGRPKTSYRKQVIILLAISVFLLLAILVSQTAFDRPFLRPGNNQDRGLRRAVGADFLFFVALTSCWCATC